MLGNDSVRAPRQPPTPAASSWRTPPSRPRASPRSRGSAFGGGGGFGGLGGRLLRWLWRPRRQRETRLHPRGASAPRLKETERISRTAGDLFISSYQRDHFLKMCGNQYRPQSQAFRNFCVWHRPAARSALPPRRPPWQIPPFAPCVALRLLHKQLGEKEPAATFAPFHI